MIINDAIKEYCNKRPANGCVIPTDEYGYWNVNVDFLNNNNSEDQTQFDIMPAYFDYATGKSEELVALWKEFCKENNFKQSSVVEIHIVGAW